MVILVDYPGDDGFSADGPQAGHVPGGLRLYVRGPPLPGLVRSVTAVMPHVLVRFQNSVTGSDLVFMRLARIH